MAFFERFDICEAYLAIERDYNKGGWLRERASNQRQMRSTEVQLHRIGFWVDGAWRGEEHLSENGREIYAMLKKRYGFRA